ncbi:MAG: MFS transporter [Thermomicrobiales bacterium]
MARLLGGRIFYGWIVVGVTFVALLISAGVRSAPSVLIHPLETELGWSRDGISFFISIGLLLFGASAPVGGWLINRFGPRKLLLFGLAVGGASAIASAKMTALWQFGLLWGFFSGIGTGVTAAALGVTIANRWFTKRRGLVLGLFGAATSAGQMIFYRTLIPMVDQLGWRGSVVVIGVLALVILTPVMLLLRDDPAELGVEPYGGPPPAPAVAVKNDGFVAVMSRAIRVPEFWLLAGSFFICGASSNGIVGVHFLPHSLDHGIPQNTAANVLAIMGGMNFIGTLASGILTDRFDPRKLLATYYILRGLSLFIVPYVFQVPGLLVFAVVFGLDYIATVPPTSALCADIFGRRNVGIVYSWVFFAHQIGAASIAYVSGVIRVESGSYLYAFIMAGILAIIGGVMALRVGHKSDVLAAPVPGVAVVRA